MHMQKNKIFPIFLVFFMMPLSSFAADLEALKVDFLQGNYRRVIFEGQSQINRIDTGSTDELKYILGLSYLKERKLDLAQVCFSLVLNNQKSKFKEQATLALADTFLIGGQLRQAEEIYIKLITNQPDTSQKAAVLYRLSQLESKQGNNQKANEYLFKLKRDFPLSPELRLGRPLEIINRRQTEVAVQETGEYSVQVGFFSSNNNAGKFRDKLIARDFPAYIYSSNGGYRVRVGKFKTLKEARDLEDRLSKEGFPTKICP